MSKVNSVRGRSSVLHKKEIPEKVTKTVHQETSRAASAEIDPSQTTKRHMQSTHSRFKLESRFNEKLNDFKCKSAQKSVTEDAKTIRNKNNEGNVNWQKLKERTANVLGKERPKSRGKLKKQKMIF